jgi:hypothetical protein
MPLPVPCKQRSAPRSVTGYAAAVDAAWTMSRWFKMACTKRPYLASAMPLGLRALSLLTLVVST